MMFLVERVGASHVFSNKAGEPCRILAWEKKEIEKSQISGEMYEAEKMGLISIVGVTAPPVVEALAKEPPVEIEPKKKK